MPIVIQCPGCSRRYQAPSAAAGKRVKCKACGVAIAVPRPPAKDSATAAGAASSLQAFIALEDREGPGPAPLVDWSSPAPVHRGGSPYKWPLILGGIGGIGGVVVLVLIGVLLLTSGGSPPASPPVSPPRSPPASPRSASNVAQAPQPPAAPAPDPARPQRTVTVAPAGFSLEPDPAPPGPRGWSDTPVKIPAVGLSFSKHCLAADHALLNHYHGYYCLDLRSGAFQAIKEYKRQAVGLSLDGSHLLMVISDTPGELAYQKVGQSAAVTKWAFEPAQPDGLRRFSGAFVNDQVAVFQTNSILLAYALPEGKVLWQYEVGREAMPFSLSPSGRYVIALPGHAVILDAQRGQVLAEVPAPPGQKFRTAAVSDTGDRIAFLTTSRVDKGIVVYDLTTGRATVEPFDLGVETVIDIQWISDRHLLGHSFTMRGGKNDLKKEWSSYLIDLERRGAVWKYSADQMLPHRRGPRLAYFVHTASNEVVFSSIAVPEPQVLARLSSVPQARPVLAPGVPVVLDLQFDEVHRKRTAQYLSSAGLVVADQADVRLEGRIETQTVGTQQYRDVRTKQQFSVDVKKIKATAAWVAKDGTVLWKAQREKTVNPSSLVIKYDGSSVQQHLDQQLDEVMQLFTTSVLPTRLAGPPRLLGTTVLSLDGAQIQWAEP
ncbi:MAG: hypothetical protein WD042_01395 [Phycisphaeraceae bacterium]